MSKINKPSYTPVVITVVSLILFLIATQVDSFSWQTKLGFLAKIGVVIGLIGTWIFTILPLMGAKK